MQKTITHVALYYSKYHDGAKKREEYLMAISEHFHLSFKKKFLDQVFLWQISLELVLSPGSQNPLESSHWAPENNDMLQGM